jgi:hypothetical protein
MDIESYVDTYFNELMIIFNPIIINYMNSSSFKKVYKNSGSDNKEKIALNMIINLYYSINSTLQTKKKID